MCKSIFAISVLLVGTVPCAWAVSTYTCTVVPIDTGGTQPMLMIPTSINNQEQIAGTLVDSSHTGFVIDHAGLNVSYAKPGNGTVIQSAVNNVAQVAGWIGDTRAPWGGPPGAELAPAAGFISNADGSVVMLDPPPGTPTQTFSEIRVSGINDNGDILGEITAIDQSGLQGQYWFIRNSSGVYSLFDPHRYPGQTIDLSGPFTVPIGSINNSGVAVLGDRIRYANGTEEAITLRGSKSYGWLWFGINNHGAIVGDVTKFEYSPPVSVVLTPDGNAQAIVCPGTPRLLPFSINDDGVVAGGVPSMPEIVIAQPTGLHSGMALSNTSWDFSPNPVGEQGGSGTIYLTSKGVADLNIQAIGVGARDAADNGEDFRITSDTCVTNLLGGGTGPKTLASGEFCAISFTFYPSGAGARSAQIEIYDDAPDAPHIIRLDGMGLGKGMLQFSNQSWDFGEQPVGSTTGPGVIYIYNPGTDVINFSSIGMTGANASDFVIGENTCGAAIAAYTTCAVGVQFAPQATGLRSAALTFYDDSGGGQQIIPLEGAGQ